MATLSKGELVPIRKALAKLGTVRWNRGVADAAAQAVEDVFVTGKAQLNTAIETAAPGVFSVNEKKALVAMVVLGHVNKDL